MKIEIPKKMIDITVEMKRLYEAKENRMTPKPIFIVFDVFRTCVDECRSILDPYLSDVKRKTKYFTNDIEDEWFDTLCELKTELKENDIEYKDHETVDTQLLSKFEAVFFTEKAAQGWIDSNRHNLSDPFIYVHSTEHMSKGWQEMEVLYDFLIEIAKKVENQVEKPD